MQIKNLKINLNQRVKVKLDNQSYEILQKEYDEFNEQFNGSLKIYVDREGYYHTQLHSLMKTFGSMIQGSYSPFVKCEIVLDEVWMNIQ